MRPCYFHSRISKFWGHEGRLSSVDSLRKAGRWFYLSSFLSQAGLKLTSVKHDVPGQLGLVGCESHALSSQKSLSGVSAIPSVCSKEDGWDIDEPYNSGKLWAR